MAKKDRQMGEVPAWSKEGPIGRLNYSCRAEQHCALKTGERKGAHPTIKLESPTFIIWQEYFERHLGGLPKAFRMFVDGELKEYTIPETLPQYFDPSFTPTPGWKSGDRVAADTWAGEVLL